jgi:hypothetical protein
VTPVEITSVFAVIVTALSPVMVPLLLRWRQTKQDNASTELVSWQGITTVLQKERDQLRAELTGVEDEFKKKIAVMKDEHAREMNQARERIGELERTVLFLSSQLQPRYQTPEPPR